MPGAGRERIRQLTDLLAEHDFGVGYFYLRKGSHGVGPGALYLGRGSAYPDYGAKDKLFYYRATALERLGRKDEAQRYFARVDRGVSGQPVGQEGAGPDRGESREKPPAPAATVDTKPQSQ